MVPTAVWQDPFRQDTPIPQRRHNIRYQSCGETYLVLRLRFSEITYYSSNMQFSTPARNRRAASQPNHLLTTDVWSLASGLFLPRSGGGLNCSSVDKHERVSLPQSPRQRTTSTSSYRTHPIDHSLPPRYLPIIAAFSSSTCHQYQQTPYTRISSTQS
jgi:hypothetical protein